VSKNSGRRARLQPCRTLVFRSTGLAAEVRLSRPKRQSPVVSDLSSPIENQPDFVRLSSPQSNQQVASSKNKLFRNFGQPSKSPEGTTEKSSDREFSITQSGAPTAQPRSSSPKSKPWESVPAPSPLHRNGTAADNSGNLCKSYLAEPSDPPPRESHA
jgi:hypothetical protein